MRHSDGPKASVTLSHVCRGGSKGKSAWLWLWAAVGGARVLILELWGPCGCIRRQNTSASSQRKDSTEARSVLFLTNMGVGRVEDVLKNAF